VIGPGGLAATATYQAPTQKAQGAELVIVNGTIVWRHGQLLTGPAPGQIVS
jgi:N-acyl-D-aspartate/D-glutamate deacylase